MAYDPSEFIGTQWTVTDGDYYVSTLGNDLTGDGSPDNPFLTVSKAFELSQDGDKVVIGPNEYIGFDIQNNAAGGSELPCRVASTDHIAIDTGGVMTIDGVLLEEGDRVLVKDQLGPALNGIYTVSSGPWSRDLNYNNSENMVRGKLIPILDGAVNRNTIYQLSNTEEIVFGTTYITFDKAAVTDWGEMRGDLNDQSDLVDLIATKATPKGVIDCSTNPNYLPGVLGDYYYASVPGKIGGAAGKDVQVGARIECIVPSSAGGDEASVGTEWVVVGNAVGGSVSKVGTPANNQIAVWTGDGTVQGTNALTFDGNSLGVAGNIYAANDDIHGLNVRSQSFSTYVVNGSVDLETNGAGSIRLRTGSTLNTRLEIDQNGIFNFLSNQLNNIQVLTSETINFGNNFLLENTGTNIDLLGARGSLTDQSLYIGGGYTGTSGSGSGIHLRGNTSVAPGDLTLFSGTIGEIYFQTGNTNRLRVFETGVFDFYTNRLTNIADPVNNQDAATKAYVDGTKVQTVSSSSSVTPSSEDDLVDITALATNSTINAPSGTPSEGQALMLRIRDNNTSRTLSWNSTYVEVGSNLPTSTTPHKVLYIACVYNNNLSRWDVVGVKEES